MCGVVGLYNSDYASHEAMLALFAIQNRGQDSCGLAVSDGQQIRLEKGMGLVKEVLTPDKLNALPGHLAVGHVRYPTRGSNDANNAQPHLLETLSGSCFALASNGDITNDATIRKELSEKGVGFQSGNDGELIMRYIAYSHLEEKLSIIDSIRKMMKNIKGAFSTVLIGKDEMWGFRDPYSIRPMSFGKIENGYAFASESKSLDILRAVDIQDVKPGEIIHVNKDGATRYEAENINDLRGEHKGCAHCVFEPIYFSMPDTQEYGLSVYTVRKEMGKKLAGYDNDLDVDLVFPAPDSANVQALGYAEGKGIPFEMALIRNHYVGRTFIKPDQTFRDESVKQKFNPIRPVIEGKKVVVVDDSIVRGTTMRKLVGMVRSAGAKEIHLRIASPQVKYPCFYGLDTNEKSELIANNMSIDEMIEYLRVDSLKYIKKEDLAESVSDHDNNFCYACFDGNYPVELIDINK